MSKFSLCCVLSLSLSQCHIQATHVNNLTLGDNRQAVWNNSQQVNLSYDQTSPYTSIQSAQTKCHSDFQ